MRIGAQAESGEGVSPRTILAFVRACCEAGRDIDAMDLICNSESLGQRFQRNYAIYHAEWVPASRKFLSPDIVTHLDSDPSTNPIAGALHGLHQFNALWRRFFAIFVVPPQPAGFVIRVPPAPAGSYLRVPDSLRLVDVLERFERVVERQFGVWSCWMIDWKIDRRCGTRR